MMVRTNVTLSLRDELLKEARHLAVDKGLSLSAYLARILEERIESVRRYDEARERHRRLMDKPTNLGTGGRITWRREDLYER